MFYPRACGSHHTEPLYFSREEVGSHHTESCCLPKGVWLPRYRIIVCFPTGRVAPTTQNHCVFKEGVRFSPHRTTVFPNGRIAVTTQNRCVFISRGVTDTTQNHCVLPSGMCGPHRTESVCAPKGEGVRLSPHRALVFSQGCVAPTTQSHCVFLMRCAALATQNHLFSQGACGSHHTESLCFPKGCTPHTITVFSQVACDNQHTESSCFPKGSVALTAQKNIVFPRAVWLPPHKVIVFSQRVCGSHHAES